MLSTCGDKRLLSSCLSPHRICTLICIREMTQWEAWQLEGSTADDSVGETGLMQRSYESEMARRGIYTAVYTLTQCSEATSKDEFLCELRDQHQCCSDFMDSVKLAMKATVESPLDSLLDLFVVLPEIISSDSPMSIVGTSPVGVYIRQSILAFNRLDFAQIEKVSRKLCDFIEPPMMNNVGTVKTRFGASKSFVDFERGKPGLPIEDQAVFLRCEPFSDAAAEHATNESTLNDHRQPDSYFAHHLHLMAQSFFRCATDALVSYFSRNFKNRMPDIVVRESHSNLIMREMKSKTAICSSRFETILLGYVAGVSGDKNGCRSLLVDATKQCHSAGDVVGVELANLISLLIFGTEMTSPNASVNGSAIQALLEESSTGTVPSSGVASSTSVPLTNEGLKYLSFVNFYKAIIQILRSDSKSTAVSSNIAALVNAYLPIIDRASPTEATQLSLVLMQTISLVYRLHGEATLAVSFDLVTLYMNAEFTAGQFFGTAPVLRAWQDLAVHNWSSPATAGVLWHRIDEIFPNQPESAKQVVDLASNFKIKLITGEFSGAEHDVIQLSSVDKSEALILSASYYLETGQLYELDGHFKKIGLDYLENTQMLFKIRLDLLKGLYFVSIGDFIRALESFDHLIQQFETSDEDCSALIAAFSANPTSRNRHMGVKSLIYLYKSLTLLKMNFIDEALQLLKSKVSILTRIYCSNFVVAQCFYLMGIASALSRQLTQAALNLNHACQIFGQIDAQPMLVHTYGAAALVAHEKDDTKSRNVFAHKFLAARQELTERDRIWVDSDVWKLSPFYFIDVLTGSFKISKN